MNKNVSILIADDDTVFPFGLKIILSHLSKKFSIKIAVNGKQVIEMLGQEKADIVFMDYNMPLLNGIEAVKIIKKKFSDTKIIVCSYYHNYEMVHELMKEGIDGYILKEAKRSTIEKALQVVMNGGEFYCDEIKRTLQQILNQAIHSAKSEEEKKKFTRRELEIIQLVYEKYSNPEIAHKLFIEVRTVETHLYNIYQESNTHSHGELKSYAERHGFFPAKNFS
jgi:DNA-binding NarL/FixJ family response regulator